MAGVNTREIIVKVVTEGGTASGGSRGSSAKQTTAELEKQLAATKSIFEQQKLLRRLVPQSEKDYGGVTAKVIEHKNALEAVNAKVREFNKIGRAGQAGWGAALKSYQFKFNALGNIVASVTSTIARGFINAIKGVINISKEFEESMSAVRAITRATDEEFIKLRGDAVRLGGATIFTANEVAKLQEQLGKLGFSTGEILNATEGVLALAAAAGEELAPSAEIAGSVLRAFNRSANDTVRIANAMAVSFTSSRLDLEKFRETMKFLAPIASTIGFTMEETTVVVAKLADTLISGSIAGTSLKNIFLRLADENSNLTKEIGFTVKSLPELIIGLEKLAKKGISANDALALTDKRAVPAMLKLIDLTPQLWDMYEAIADSTGAAQEMSETRMDNFAGSVEKLTGAWDSFVLAINKSNRGLRIFADGLRYLLEDTGELIKSQSVKLEESVSYSIKLFKERADREVALENATTTAIQQIYVERYRAGVYTEEQLLEHLMRLRNKALVFSEQALKIELQKELGAMQDRYNETERLYKQEVKHNTSMGIHITSRLERELKKRFALQEGYIVALLELEDQFTEEDKYKKLQQLEADINADKAANMKQREIDLALMKENMDKEIAAVRLKWDKFSEANEEYSVDYKKLAAKVEEDIRAIRKKYADEAIKAIEKEAAARQKVLENIDKLRLGSLESGFYAQERAEEAAYKKEFANLEAQLEANELTTDEYLEALIYLEEGHWLRMADIRKTEREKEAAAAQKAADEALKAAEDRAKKKEQMTKFVRTITIESISDPKTQAIAETRAEYDDQLKMLDSFYEDGKEKGKEYYNYLTNIRIAYYNKLDDIDEQYSKTLGDSFTGGMAKLLGVSEDDIKQMGETLEKGVDFVLDQLNRLAQERSRLADQAVSDSERQVNQAQRALEIELDLAEKGFASNVSIRQQELKSAEGAQKKALAQRRAAHEEDMKIQKATQLTSLVTASANILAGTARDPISLIIAFGTIAAMISTFASTQTQLRDTVDSYGEGGPIIGKKHSEGGKVIEAEDGEYMIRAKQYSKYPDLVEAINNDNIAQVWGGLNQDLSVSLDDSQTAKMLGKHFKGQVIEVPGGRIEKYGNRTRRIRYRA